MTQVKMRHRKKQDIESNSSFANVTSATRNSFLDSKILHKTSMTCHNVLDKITYKQTLATYKCCGAVNSQLKIYNMTHKTEARNSTITSKNYITGQLPNSTKSNNSAGTTTERVLDSSTSNHSTLAYKNPFSKHTNDYIHSNTTAGKPLYNYSRLANSFLTPYPFMLCVSLITLCALTEPVMSYSLEYQKTLSPPPEVNGGDDPKWFGYTVAFYARGNENYLLVGAPGSESKQEDVTTPGVVYSCRAKNNFSNPCEKLKVDTSSKNEKYDKKISVDHKDNQRLGASLAVADQDVLVCAPNWNYEHQNKYGIRTGTPVGKCFYSDSGPYDSFTPFSPPFDITDPPQYYYTYGYCQSGVSATFYKYSSSSVPKAGRAAVLGSPGCNTWSGDVLVGVGGSDNYRRKNLTYTEQDFIEGSTSTRPVVPFDRYLGYDVAVGRFNGRVSVVASSPKPAIMKQLGSLIVKPSVTIMFENEFNSFNIWKQLYTPDNKAWEFAYCGYSISVGDLDNDGLDDVAVGCPYYGKDSGAVLIYYQRKIGSTYEMKLETPWRMNEEINSKFGSSVTIIDDIDDDGYKELAVGAPFLGGETGAVYIYCTRDGALPDKPCQTLQPAEGVRWFGWSVASRRESSSVNVAVSAPVTNSVFVYRGKPVLRFSMTLAALGELDPNKLCSMPNDGTTAYPCADMKLCIIYTLGNTQPANDGRKRVFNVAIAEDTEDPSSLLFDNNEAKKLLSFNLIPTKKTCQNVKVFQKTIPNRIVDYAVKADATFVNETDDKVIVSGDSRFQATEFLNMKIECDSGEIATCKSNVQLTMRLEGEYKYGEGQATVVINLENTGEPAYNSKLLVNTRGDLISSGKAVVTGAAENCDKVSSNLIVCNLGGLSVFMPGKISYTFNFKESSDLIARQEHAEPLLHVDASFLTKSQLLDEAATNKTLRVPIKLTPKVELTRNQVPEQLDLNIKAAGGSKLKELGPPMKHTYSVDNKHSYRLYGVTFTIYWPYYHKTVEGYLLYVGAPPVITLDEKHGRLKTGAPRCIATTGGIFDELHLNPDNVVDTEVDTSTPPESKSSAMGQTSPPSTLDESIRYLVIECTVDMIPEDSTVTVDINSFADAGTFKKLSGDDGMRSISSTAVVSVKYASFETPVSSSSATIINSILYKRKKIWPIILGSALGGFLILALLIFLAYKCGWCTKKKTPDEADGGEEDGEEGDGEFVEGEEPLMDEQERNNGDQADRNLDFPFV